MSGTVGPRISPFINTYSLDFDGVDDYVEIGTQSLGITGAISVSAWVKIPISGVWAAPYVQGICVENGTSGINWALYFRPPPFFNYFSFQIYHTNGTSTILTSSGVTPNDGQWHHLLATSDGTTNANGVKLFVDGVLNVQATATSTGTKSTPTVIPTIGATSNNSWYFEGNIDEVSVFNTDQSSNIATLSTAPTVDLSSLNPLAWYRMGDNGAYKDPQWLIPSNENKDKVSNYSMEFDGVNDYIDCGDSDDFSFGNGTTDSPFSISIWVNFSSIGGSTFKGIIGKDNGTQREWALLDNNSGRLRIFLKNQGGGNQQSIDTTSVLSINTWYHIVVTYNGVGGNNAADGLTLYLNGIEETPTNIIKNTYVAMSNTSAPLTIGKYSLNEFPGNIDATSIFNRELSISEVTSIYNGGGVATPGDLTPLNPIAWWKMGEEATFSGGVWTVPDEVGTNDGTSANMTIEDRVGEAPNSSNNAVSFNMDLIDRVEDTPPTP